jgi:hypothetical protein
MTLKVAAGLNRNALMVSIKATKKPNSCFFSQGGPSIINGSISGVFGCSGVSIWLILGLSNLTAIKKAPPGGFKSSQ